MHVLVVRKPTNFELHGERVQSSIARGFRSTQELKSLKATHKQHYETFDTIINDLAKHNISHTVILREEEWPQAQSFDYVVTVGGDGTLLSASHKLAADAKLIGVRSSDASVGFTSAYSNATVANLILDLKQNQVPFVSVHRMYAEIERLSDLKPQRTVPILNDILFANVNPAATSQYCIRVGDREESQKSSGVWVATAVGSTAGIHAAGGKALDIKDRHFQYRVREPYKQAGSQLMLVGDIFDPLTTIFSIESRNESAMIALDGPHGEFQLEYGDRVTFKSAGTLYLARPLSSYPPGL